jgi:hypothetical protein
VDADAAASSLRAPAKQSIAAPATSEKLDYFVASLLVVTERPVEKAVDSLWKTG